MKRIKGFYEAQPFIRMEDVDGAVLLDGVITKVIERKGDGMVFVFVYNEDEDQWKVLEQVKNIYQLHPDLLDAILG